MTTHDQHQPAAPTTVLPTYDPTPTVPAGTALPIEPTAVTPAAAHAAEPETPAAPAKPTPVDFIGTLDGWDELAIERAFGKEYTDLGESMKSLRALAMILLKRRDDLDPTRAYNAAMGLKTNDLLGLFNLDDEEDATAALAALMGGKAPQG